MGQPLAGGLAGANAAATGFVSLKALSLSGYEVVGVVTALVAGLGACLAAHRLVLRTRVVRAFSLSAVSAGDFLLAAVPTTAEGAEGGGLLFATLFGAVYGTANGWVLKVLLHLLPSWPSDLTASAEGRFAAGGAEQSCGAWRTTLQSSGEDSAQGATGTARA